MTKTALNLEAINRSPLQQLHSRFLERFGIRLLIKRDDLIHADFGGNKWRKLKYNLIHADEYRTTDESVDSILTFGGAWSNHIYATAAACRHFGFESIGIIRGENTSVSNPCLRFAQNCGMKLSFVSREDYRHKDDPEFLAQLREQYGNIYILPEGGSNDLAVKGCMEIVEEIDTELDDQPFDIITSACGTGATLAGIIAAINTARTKSDRLAIGFSALKGGHFLNREVSSFLQLEQAQNWKIEDRFHFGGYAKVNDDLLEFIRMFRDQYGVMLDAVYTAKMFYGLFELIKSRSFRPGSTIVAIHSGGLQGNKGFDI